MPADRWQAVFALARDRRRETLLVLSQVYVPDPASLGQHVHDACAELARRGLRVVVLAADSGYEDPARRYPRYELLDGVHVLRLPMSSFGKSSLALRLIGGSVFLAQAISLAFGLRRVDRVLVSTSPPMCGLAGLAIRALHRVPLTYWVMDLNPDQIVALGGLPARSAPVVALDAINRRVLRRASRVVALDRFMADRLCQKHDVRDKLSIIPPWPLIDVRASDGGRGQNGFRVRHGFGDARVLMYSGNLSPVHPVGTLLEALTALRDEPRLRVVFVGGGAGRAEIERFKREQRLDNVLTLPYQPLASLRESLSAADVHLVAMGEAMVGVVHPCKVYGAMAAGRPILSLGPERSHIADLVITETIGWHVRHGDVVGMANALREIVTCEPAMLERKGQRAARTIEQRLSRESLRDRFCDLFEAHPPRTGSPALMPQRKPRGQAEL